MKKILLFLFIMFGLNLAVSAQETPINVIYIHGSNQINIGGADEFTVWINRMHADLKKNFEKNDFIKSHLLSDAYIKAQPDMLYWGDMLLDSKSLIDDGLKKTKTNSSTVLQSIRGFIAQNVHDAVWLQKNKNMVFILEKLNNKVTTNYKNGEKTMLVGYSAGTFVTMNYIRMKTPVINLNNLFEQFKGQYNLTNKDVSLAAKYAAQNTCVAAAVKSNLFIDKDGIFSLNKNPKERENALKRIAQETALTCAPEGAISGVLNFGSPIIVFYSELSAANPLNRYILTKSMQNIIETKKFYLTANYAKDPIAMPLPDFTFEQISQYKNCKDIKRGDGFIYDTIIKGGGVIAQGHKKYWYTTNVYTKAVAKAYENGYKHFYGK